MVHVSWIAVARCKSFDGLSCKDLADGFGYLVVDLVVDPTDRNLPVAIKVRNKYLAKLVRLSTLKGSQSFYAHFMYMYIIMYNIKQGNVCHRVHYNYVEYDACYYSTYCVRIMIHNVQVVN